MYQDTVEEEKRLHQPVFLLILFAVVFAIAFLFDFSQSFIGHLLTMVTGPVEESGLYGRFVTSFFITVLFVVNLFAISFLPFRQQAIIVWLELLTVFLGFFYSFNLSMEFIESKIWFMISKGLVTTLYVSAISIVIATIIALFGAVAKLSTNGFAFAIASFYTSFLEGCHC